MLGDSASASIESGITVTSQFIAKAVEASHRQIYRAPVLGNLDLMLAQEVDRGNFIKVGEDQFRIAPFPSPFYPQHSLLSLNPPLAHPPPAPVPVNELMMDSTESLRTSPPKVMPPPPPPPPPQAAFPPPAAPLPTDEQRKNDLIAAKLSKLEGKCKSPNKNKVASSSHEKNRHKPCSFSPPVVEVRKEPLVQLDEDLPLTVARSVNHSNADEAAHTAAAAAAAVDIKSKVAKKKSRSGGGVGATVVTTSDVSQACKKNSFSSSADSAASMSRSFRKKVPNRNF